MRGKYPKYAKNSCNLISKKTNNPIFQMGRGPEQTFFHRRDTTPQHIPIDIKTLIQKDVFTPVFIAALFTVANMWTQSKYSSTDKEIKMWYIYSGMLAIKKNETMLFATTLMDLEE